MKKNKKPSSLQATVIEQSFALLWGLIAVIPF
jgi:hypothetical protein